MIKAERIFQDGKFIGIVHIANNKWYVTIPSRKNLNTPKFRTCGNGIVRKPNIKLNYHSEPMTWDNKEEAIYFLKKIF